MLGTMSAADFVPVMPLRSKSLRRISVAEMARLRMSVPCLIAVTVTSCRLSVSAVVDALAVSAIAPIVVAVRTKRFFIGAKLHHSIIASNH